MYSLFIKTDLNILSKPFLSCVFFGAVGFSKLPCATQVLAETTAQRRRRNVTSRLEMSAGLDQLSSAGVRGLYLNRV